MFAKLFSRTPADPKIEERLYSEIVAQSRSPGFYADLAVPDTLEGRFEMILLHQIFVYRRLGELGPEGKDLAQRAFDLFLSDMDQSLREMGVGDLSVPKRMKDMTGAFFGRAKAYTEALEAGDSDDSAATEAGDALAAALRRNVYGGNLKHAVAEHITTEPARLATYARMLSDALARQDETALLAIDLSWPSLEDVQ